MSIYKLYRNFAFRFDPENVHEKTLQVLSHIPHGFTPQYFKKKLKYQIVRSNINWPNPIGIAAGLDKNAQVFNQLLQLGFGHVEVGTVTLKGQEGNPKPRIWRLPQEYSFRNAMGFPSLGQNSMGQKLCESPTSREGLVGVNIGMNKSTPLEQAHQEYSQLFDYFVPKSHYIAINISSPNTPGLRELQRSEYLENLLGFLSLKRKNTQHPLFLKISPDLSSNQVEMIYTLCRKFKLSGIIATNTTQMPSYGQGGISGQLLFQKSQKIRSQLLDLNKDDREFTIIGVGGFSRPSELFDYWAQGGNLIQVFTSFIYQGPSLLEKIHSSIDEYMEVTQTPDFESMLQDTQSLKEFGEFLKQRGD